MPNPFGRWSLPNLLFHHGAPIQPTDNNNDHGLGRYSLPSVLGRLLHHSSYTPGPLSQEGPLSGPAYSGYNFSLNSPPTTAPGYQTMPITPFQPIDPNSLHVTPILDYRAEGGGNGNGGNAGMGNTGMNSGGAAFGSALAGWGVSRGPNYT